jgi:hypothetical protein
MYVHPDVKYVFFLITLKLSSDSITNPVQKNDC